MKAGDKDLGALYKSLFSNSVMPPGCDVVAYVKMSSMRQAMVIFSRSLRSLATSAGCAFSSDAYLEHRAS